MRLPAVTNPIAACFALAAALCFGGGEDRAFAEAGTPAAPAVRVLYDVMTCAPVFEQPDEGARGELTAGAIVEPRPVRIWRANIYDPSDCLRLKLEQI